MLLALSTWPEITERLKTDRSIIIPIGSNEQHGPMGFLGTDWLCPEIIAHKAHDEGSLLVAPTFNIGMAQHHLGFPGTISLRPSTFMAAIEDWVMSLSRHGFDSIYFLNGHGGNVASIEAAFSEIYSRYSYAAKPCPFRLGLKNWWDLPGMHKLAARLFPEGHGSHATPSEISVTFAAYPDQVKSAIMNPPIAPDGPIRDALDYSARFKDGRIGANSSLATVEYGEEFIALGVKGLIDSVRAFRDDPSPS
jgi:creatinine amidohydrolase